MDALPIVIGLFGVMVGQWFATRIITLHLKEIQETLSDILVELRK